MVSVDRRLEIREADRADDDLHCTMGTSFDRLMIAQDTGSAIVGSRARGYLLGAGDRAADFAGRVRHPGSFAILVPRELDPVAAGARMPLPPQKPPAAKASVRNTLPKLPTLVQGSPVQSSRGVRKRSPPPIPSAQRMFRHELSRSKARIRSH
jgi:3D domain